MNRQPFSRVQAFLAAVQALMTQGIPALAAFQQAEPYRSRGKGEGCYGNKHAKSSFKQNKRRGL